MFASDLVHFRAALGTGVSHDTILLSPLTTPATSAANTPDNRSLASEKKKKNRLSAFFSRPAPRVKAAAVGAGMKLPMNIA